MRVLDVPQITAYIKDLIELDPILSDVWVRGEVSNLSRSAAGHMYFCLTSDGAQMNCVLFRGNQFGILATPRNGDEVLAHGRISIYETRGQYQLMVDNVAPEGIGILQLQFEETKRRLEVDGLFAAERKRALPPIPAVIGVVTSAQGAVWHDIQTVVARRFPLTELILAPSAVQGPQAVDELIAGLRALEESGMCDVVIIGRGGGAAEDLAAFNDERLARAIFACTVPTVSAVGHETDECIADLVADVRAPTPSAAAELCVPNGHDLISAADGLLHRSRAYTYRAMRDARLDLESVVAHIDRQHPRARIARDRQDVDAMASASRRSIDQLLETQRRRVDETTARAALLDPRDVLRRGYAIVSQRRQGCVRRITSASAARAAGNLELTFHDGTLRTSVDRDGT